MKQHDFSNSERSTQKPLRRSKQTGSESLRRPQLPSFALENASAALENLKPPRQDFSRFDRVTDKAVQAKVHCSQTCEQFVDLAPDAYIVTNMKGRVQIVNAAAATLLGRTCDFLSGRLLAPFIARQDLSEFYRMITKLACGVVERFDDVPMRLKSKHKDPVATSMSVAVVKDTNQSYACENF